MDENTASVTIRNMDSASDADEGGAWTVPMAPTELSYEVAVEWAKMNVQGMSHQQLQYSHTANPPIPLEFVIARDLVDPLLAQSDANILYASRFLLSLTVPGRGPTGEVMDRPPEALLIWPRLMTARVVVNKVKFRFESFSDKLGPWTYITAVEFERVRDVRVLSEDMVARGLMA